MTTGEWTITEKAMLCSEHCASANYTVEEAIGNVEGLQQQKGDESL